VLDRRLEGRGVSSTGVAFFLQADLIWTAVETAPPRYRRRAQP
jgi:hypothetical protein